MRIFCIYVTEYLGKSEVIRGRWKDVRKSIMISKPHVLVQQWAECAICLFLSQSIFPLHTPPALQSHLAALTLHAKNLTATLRRA
jgi:hypothetical protein